jgi:hypothetical protein
MRRTSGGTQETDGEPTITHLSLDAPVVHPVNAGEASNEVKFKTGAELSGQVNSAGVDPQTGSTPVRTPPRTAPEHLAG